jgi:hypothetical protein
MSLALEAKVRMRLQPRERTMGFPFTDVIRHFFGGDQKEEPAFKSEKEAYDFCRQVYNESGGVPPELLRAYEFYLKNFDDSCDSTVRYQKNSHNPA